MSEEPVVLHMRGRVASWWIVSVWWRLTGKRPWRKPTAVQYMRTLKSDNERIRSAILARQADIDAEPRCEGCGRVDRPGYCRCGEGPCH